MISMFGYGKVAKSIVSNYKVGEWNIYDDSFTLNSKDEFGNNLLKSNEFNPDLSTLEVVSPGISPDNHLCKIAKNLTSEIDFYYEAMPLSIWVSGTNGKTTTTQMIASLLDIQAGANIGLPVALMDLSKSMVVLEMSSFALHYTKIARPEIYALLPIEDDHISWHGSFKNYEKAKLDVIFRMSKTASVIVPKKYENYLKNTKCVKYFYEDEFDLASIFNIDIKKINFSKPFLLDAVMALSVSKIVNANIEYDKINKFKIGAHKKFEFVDKFNRIWVDDSKATNISASLAAIKSYKNKLHLIIGGDSKGQDLRILFNEIPKNTKVYLIGKTDFSDLAKEFNLSYIRTNLKEAVEIIYKNLKIDEIALLSPACASLDEYSSYAERGDKFISYVKDLDV